MTEEFSVTHPGRSLSWSKTWIMALTQPSEASYAEIANDPSATQDKAYIWIFISSLIGSIVSLVLYNLFESPLMAPGEEGLFGGSMFVYLLCCAPIGSLLSVLGTIISVGITQWIASLLGGTGSYSELIYVVAAYSAPLALIVSPFTAIPCLGCLTIPLALYAALLNIIAVKTVNKFSWGQAVAASLIIPVLFIGVAIIIIFVLSLLGPTVGNIFSNIIQDLESVP